jgi:hypothetical protein
MCAQAPPTHTTAAVQTFEYGTMIWLEARDQFYLLYDTFVTPGGGTTTPSTKTTLQIVTGPLTLTSGASPDNRVDESPPPGLFEPVSGFGLLWRGEVVGVQDVRQHLGWAREPELGFATDIQCETPCGAHQSCYLRLPNGEVLRTAYMQHVGYVWEMEDHK